MSLDQPLMLTKPTKGSFDYDVDLNGNFKEIMDRDKDIVGEMGRLANKWDETDNTVRIYVSTTGNDTSDGMSATQAVSTLIRASEIAHRIPGIGSIIIEIAPGTYNVSSTVTFAVLNRRIFLYGGSKGDNADSVTLNITHAGKGIYAYGCNYCGIYGLTLNRTVQGTDALVYAEGSNLILNACAIQANAVQTNAASIGVNTVSGRLFFSNGAIKRISNSNFAVKKCIKWGLKLA